MDDFQIALRFIAQKIAVVLGEEEIVDMKGHEEKIFALFSTFDPKIEQIVDWVEQKEGFGDRERAEVSKMQRMYKLACEMRDAR